MWIIKKSYDPVLLVCIDQITTYKTVAFRSASYLIIAFKISLYLLKCDFKDSLGVFHAKPPTNTFVNVVLPVPLLLIIVIFEVYA